MVTGGRKITLDDFDMTVGDTELVAIHEVGHACAALLAGVEFDRVGLGGGLWTSCAGDLRMKEFREVELAVRLGGPVAEIAEQQRRANSRIPLSQYFDFQRNNGWQADVPQALAALGPVEGSPEDELLRLIQEEADEFQSKLLDRCRAVVKDALGHGKLFVLPEQVRAILDSSNKV